MIQVTRLNGTRYYINPELIQFLEETPDTMITLIDKTIYVVKESAEEITARYIDYRRKIHAPALGQSEQQEIIAEK